jgi:hypothetical protein
VILAHRRPVPHGRPEADDLSVGTELVAVGAQGVEVIEAPVAGWSLARPVRADDGRLACYRLPAGRSTDLHFAEVSLAVEGLDVTPTTASARSFFAEFDAVGGRGHAEWMPDGRIVEAQLAQRRVGWWPWPLRQAWRCVAVDPDTGRTEPLSPDGWAEPSWHRTAGLAWAAVGGRGVQVPGLGLKFDTPGQQAFDPYVSPDCRHVVTLVRGRRWGLWLVDVATGVGRWLVDPADATVEVSHARWDSDASVVCSMKLVHEHTGTWGKPSTWYWRLVRVHLDGRREWLTGPADGSVEQPFPV